MNKQPNHHENNDSPRGIIVARTARQDDQHSSLHDAAVISRIFLAVFIIGFMGYYLDKALEIIRQ